LCLIFGIFRPENNFLYYWLSIINILFLLIYPLFAPFECSNYSPGGSCCWRSSLLKKVKQNRFKGWKSVFYSFSD
jgi:hypothetical protein